jgi:hypothetical protein
MATGWFIYREDERHGPYSSAEIRRLARSGDLQPNDLLWKEGMHKKRRAGSSAKLFPTAGPKPATARTEAESDFGFRLDDPRLIRRAILMGGVAALVALVTALAISVWPESEPVNSPLAAGHAQQDPGATVDQERPAVIAPQREPVAPSPVVTPPPVVVRPPPVPSPPPPGVPDDF